MSYRQRLSLFTAIDSCVVLGAIFTSYFLVYGTLNVATLPIVASSMIILSTHHVFSIYFKLYKKIWEYASISELWLILKIASLAIGTACVISFMVFHPVPYRFLMATWFLYMMFIGGSRFLWRIFRDRLIWKHDTKRRALIVGAGSAGTMVARQLLREWDGDLLPVAFIDDDTRKQQLDILGIPVVGGVNDIPKVVASFRVDHIIISIPSLEKKALNAIYLECAKTKAQTKILPLLEDLITGRISVKQFRDVQVEDLLGRDPVELDMSSILSFIDNSIVLVTGAGGSIGSEIARQIMAFRPATLILLGHGENSIFKIDLELRERFQQGEIEIITEIADIQDAEKMIQIMRLYQPDVIYHAAAHKHVPLMERNPEAAVKNNMFGTLNVAKAASIANVNTFVMVSTDKAVNPTSVMGASKRLAEMIIQDFGKKSRTKFVAVRFGNVLGSRGSVIPLFKKQIEKGGPITITHPDMVRFFMTIPEASRLVIQAGVLAKGGETFVLDMGNPVKIIDLATNLIKLSGHSEDDINIEFTGIRPGEKLFEELWNEGEVHEERVYPKIYVGKATDIYMDDINHMMANFHLYDKERLRDIMLKLANHEPIKQREKVKVPM